MKKHSGGKIQFLASVVIIAAIVIGLISAGVASYIVRLFVGETGENFGMVLGLAIFVIWCFRGWFIACILRGFGEIVENTAEIAGYLRILVTHFTSEAMPASVNEPEEKVEPKAKLNIPETVAESEPQQIKTVKFPFDRSTVEKITCPVCQREQFSSRDKCYHCGAEFLFTDSEEPV